MQTDLIIEFTKMNGIGNDFIVIDNRFFHFSAEELSILAKKMCKRRFGIGADGLMALADSDHYDYRMIFFNADGSEAPMCGNGARCLARFAAWVGVGSGEMTFEAPAGVYKVFVPESQEESVKMWVPDPKNYRKVNDLAVSDLSDNHYINTGTDHAVCFVNDINAVDVQITGKAVRFDDAFAPAGANVNFATINSNQNDYAIDLRTYERGVEGETWACGTGAMAAAMIARQENRIAADQITVKMPGGDVIIGFNYENGIFSDVTMTGPAEIVFRGTFNVKTEGPRSLH